MTARSITGTLVRMKSLSALTLLTASTLALASCSSTADTSDAPTSEPVATEITATTETSTAPHTFSAETTSPSAMSKGINVPGFRSNLEQAGYTCDKDDDCTRTADAATYKVDFDSDSVSATVTGASNDREKHIDAVLSDVGVALGEYDFGETSWTEIKEWTLSNTAADAARDDAEAILGNIHLEAETDDDGYGVDIDLTA